MNYAEIVAVFIIGAALASVIVWLLLRNKLTLAEKAREQIISISEKLNAAHTELEIQRSAMQANRLEVHKLLSEIGTSKAAIARLETEKFGLQSTLSTQLEERNKLELRFTREFENLANRIFQEKSTAFISQNKLSLDAVLSPLRDRSTFPQR